MARIAEPHVHARSRGSAGIGIDRRFVIAHDHRRWPDGKLYFNLLPGVDVWGLTLTEAKTRLENTFTNYLREQPRIAMTLRGVESKRVWILGCVQAPGVYTMATPMTLLEAISMAGGR